MSNPDQDKQASDAVHAADRRDSPAHEIQIDPRILQKSRLPLYIALFSFVG
jgi:hypothetical protein